jgi:hypothetical protein
MKITEKDAERDSLDGAVSTGWGGVFDGGRQRRLKNLFVCAKLI